MIEKLQRTLVLLGLAAVVAWAIHCANSGNYAQMPWLPAALVAVYAGVLAIEFTLLAVHARATLAARAPRPAQLAAAWWSEFHSTPAVFAWQQPFRARRWPDHLPANASGRRGVLLVHGYFCNRGLWNSWMRELRRSDTPFVAVTMEPVFGSIDDYAASIEAAVQRLESCTGLAPVAVAHSMGGLATRNWWAKARPASQAGTSRRLHSLITIGTPHHGTWMAGFATSTNARQMRQQSAWLRDLHAIEPLEHRRRTICYYSDCDNIVFPTVSATLPEADNRRLGNLAHVAMINDPAPYAELQRQLAQPPITGAAESSVVR